MVKVSLKELEPTKLVEHFRNVNKELQTEFDRKDLFQKTFNREDSIIQNTMLNEGWCARLPGGGG